MLRNSTRSQIYNGLERRSSSERRIGRDRRNLYRFESFGSDRRRQSLRRREELLLERMLDS